MELRHLPGDLSEVRTADRSPCQGRNIRRGIRPICDYLPCAKPKMSGDEAGSVVYSGLCEMGDKMKI